MNDACRGRGPTGVGDWQDDLTVVVFAVPNEAAAAPDRVEAHAGSHAAVRLADPIGVDK